MIKQAGCVPYRPTETDYQILLITTKKGNCTIPKGIIDPGETPRETAAKEAFEEAGIRGPVEEEVVGTFTYEKWNEELTVEVYLQRVDELHDDFDDDHFRQREWLAPANAVKRIRKRIRRVLKKAVAILDERHGGAEPATSSR